MFKGKPQLDVEVKAMETEWRALMYSSITYLVLAVIELDAFVEEQAHNGKVAWSFRNQLWTVRRATSTYARQRMDELNSADRSYLQRQIEERQP